ncbi:DUF1156 domain-containing protein [Microbacterium sp. YY-03]|uniref:DUF1156 domain-containing protein n=1 Tax=Microbacterium sp. YY-03 TaxID=3421636 RepID=UPI003D178EE7
MLPKKKLIEVALPLEAINAQSAREKSIRHGHPSTLHLWWARRPLATARAVLFAQLVDDPGGHFDEYLAQAERDGATDAAASATAMVDAERQSANRLIAMLPQRIAQSQRTRSGNSWADRDEDTWIDKL